MVPVSKSVAHAVAVFRPYRVVHNEGMLFPDDCDIARGMLSSSLVVSLRFDGPIYAKREMRERCNKRQRNSIQCHSNIAPRK